jgi:hypothetical protein
MTEKQNECTTAGRKTDIRGYFQQLLAKSGEVFQYSMSAPNSSKNASSHIFVGEMEVWCKVLSQRREVELLKVATVEYEFALFALTQGHYRHAFKALRLVLELILQAICLSANETPPA